MVLTADSHANHVLHMRTLVVIWFLEGVYVATATPVPCVIDHVLQERLVETVLNHRVWGIEISS